MSKMELVVGILGGLSLIALFSAYLAVGLRLFNKPKVAQEELFFVSILKPLKGVDESLYENLRAIVSQNHPHFEVIFGAESPHDPALAVARRIAQDFPHRAIKVVVGSQGRGLNPKVRLLRRLIQEANASWILISDSNVRPLPDYLRQMQARQLETGADLVHSVLSGVGGRSLGGRLEELQLNGWVAASICLSDRFDHPCVIGKSMLLRRKALASIGGLLAVEDILAEDYVTGARLARAGKVVALSPDVLPVITGSASLRQFMNRHVRWGQMRRQISPLFFVLELGANPTPFLLLLAALASDDLRLYALLAQAMKWTVDAVIYLSLAVAPSGKTLLLIPLKDILVLVMWSISLFKRTVDWRGQKMLVGPGSRLLPLEEAGPNLTRAAA